MSQQHIIGRTVLEIDIDRLDEMWSFQNDISDLLQQRVVPEMGRLFDQWVSVDEVVRLDRVVVIVDPIDRRFLADEFVRNILDALSQALSDRLTLGLPMATDAESIKRDRSRANANLSEIGLPIESEVEIIRRERSRADWEVLLYFLEYGRLPWWSLIEDWLRWLTRWETVMQTESHWQNPLRALLTTEQVARQRLVAQFSEGFRHQLVLQLQPTWSRWSNLLNQARQLIQSMGLSHRAYQQLEIQAWLLLLEELGREQSPNRPLPTSQWIRAWLTHLMQIWQSDSSTATRMPLSLDSLANSVPTQSDPSVTTVIANTSSNQAETVSLEQTSSWAIAYHHLHTLLETISAAERFLWLEEIDRVIPHLSTDQTLGSETPPIKPTSQDNHEAQTDLFSAPHNNVDLVDRNLNVSVEPIVEELENDLSPDMKIAQVSDLDRNLDFDPRSVDTFRQISDSQISAEEEVTGLFVNQSGLVILHPFLSLYFEDIGLLDGETFRDEVAQQTAIYLLHYLATRQTDAPEYELVLPKILCGWSLSKPIARGLPLPDRAMAEGENLLQSVINYWQVLKTTSPDGLREGFLQRAGKLTRLEEGDWRLQVEQKAIDVLLGSLPWGMNVIKLPWMANLLMVEWS
jgi:hypothetical protein